MIEILITTCIWVVVAVWVWRLVLRLEQRNFQIGIYHGTTQTHAILIGLFLKTVLCVFLLLGILRTWRLDISALMAAVGVMALTLAFATRKIGKELIASCSILIDRPFTVGDLVLFGDIKGTIENIGLRSTIVKSITGEEIVLSHDDVVSGYLKNFDVMDARRGVIHLPIPFDTPTSQLSIISKILEEAITKQEKVVIRRGVHVKQYKKKGLIFEVDFEVLDKNMKVFTKHLNSINLEIFRLLLEKDIVLRANPAKYHVITKKKN